MDGMSVSITNGKSTSISTGSPPSPCITTVAIDHQLAHLGKELVPCDHESVHVRHASPWRQDGVSIIEPGLPIT